MPLKPQDGENEGQGNRFQQDFDPPEEKDLSGFSADDQSAGGSGDVEHRKENHPAAPGGGTGAQTGASPETSRMMQQIFQAPEVSTRITAAQVKKSTLGLRVPVEVNEWWQRWGKMLQAIYGIPDGVLPEIAGQVIVENQQEIERRAVEWKNAQNGG